MKKTLYVLASIASLIAFSFVYAQAPVAIEIPAIEQWKEIHLDGEHNSNQEDPFLIRWYRDQSGEQGLIASYRRWPGDNPVPFIKLWGSQGDYAFQHAHTALLTEDGTWVVGRQGEKVLISIGETIDDTTTAFVFTFNREHSSVSRTIVFSHAPPSHQ